MGGFIASIADALSRSYRPVDQGTQRAAVVEAELRVRQQLGGGDAESPAMPALATAIRGLRILNKAAVDAKHLGEDGPVPATRRSRSDLDSQVNPAYDRQNLVLLPLVFVKNHRVR